MKKSEFRKKCKNTKVKGKKCKKKSKWSIKKIIFLRKQDRQANLPNKDKFYRKRSLRWNVI